MHHVSFIRTTRLHETSAGKSGVNPRLKPAAHEFEASLIQELLKPLQHDPLFSDSANNGSSMIGDAGMDTWSSLGTQSLAKAISDAGGLGIAGKMIAEVETEAKEKSEASKTMAKDASADKEMPLSEGNTHLHAWSTVRRLP